MSKKLKDHRQIGKELDLFSFHEIAPGAVFWHPKGWVIYQEITALLRSMLAKSGYQEIKTPVMVRSELFKKSGHWKHFGERNMFNLSIKDDQSSSSLYSLKPMNCPESTRIFNACTRSYKDLPIKFSEFGILHRNELSGVLGGLFRLREFTIDDAHIYCTQEQIQEVVGELLKQILAFYKIFGFKLSFYLSTKPDKALEIANKPTLWADAEKDLDASLTGLGIKFNVKEKDGAFYGPKIDFHMTDSQERDWQLATVQLDFQLPRALDVKYIDSDGKKHYAVMIHRAFTGSIERFVGILIEQYQGAFPLWLAPVQVSILPISDKFLKQAEHIHQLFGDKEIRSTVNTDNKTVSAKIRESALQKVPYLCIIGDKELKEAKKSNSPQVTVRSRDGDDMGIMDINKFIKTLSNDIEKKV